MYFCSFSANHIRHMDHCPLCKSTNLKPVHPPHDRRYYYHCSDCSLIFTDPKFFLSPEESRLRYLNHQNSIQQKGYVDFLNQAILPALSLLNAEMQGLDYGCGPGPTLSLLLKNRGFSCDNYDPVFFGQFKKERYDFIFSTECFEHFLEPAVDLQKITDLLINEGLLIVMTSQWKNQDHFEKWYYKNDPTHVSFYHSRTFHTICSLFHYELLYNDGERVVILKKVPQANHTS